MEDAVGQLVKGLAAHMNKSLYAIVQICTETMEDYVFLERQLISRKEPFFAVAALRSYKLDTRKYSRDQFKSDYAKSKRMALEQLFLNPVHNIDVRISNLDLLYDLHNQFPTKTLPRLLHLYNSKDFVQKEA